MVSDHDDRNAHARPERGEWSWIMRGANFVVGIVDVAAGSVLERTDHPDESMVLLLDVSARIDADEKSIEAEAESLVILPPGSSRIEARGAGRVIRIFSSAAADLVDRATNAAAYAQGDERCAPLIAWPAPADGLRLRHYRLADYPNSPGSDLRIFRCTNLMINFLRKRDAPRDLAKLTPHSHADFEQASLAVQGRYVHHARYPWTADFAEWRDDEHIEVGSPSLTIIPSSVIHTSRNVDAPAWLIDIFAPPRIDFARMPGAVKNAADYPMPEPERTA